MAPPTSASPHTCTKCDQTFPKQHSLQAHKRDNTHTHISTCANCGKRFAAKAAFATHRRGCEKGKATETDTKKVPKNATLKPTPMTKPKSKPKPPSKTMPMPTARRQAYISGCTEANDCEQHGLDWALCDGDCGWCGHCYDGYCSD